MSKLLRTNANLLRLKKEPTLKIAAEVTEIKMPECAAFLNLGKAFTEY